jgi:hypothetical protein
MRVNIFLVIQQFQKWFNKFMRTIMNILYELFYFSLNRSNSRLFAENDVKAKNQNKF